MIIIHKSYTLVFQTLKRTRIKMPSNGNHDQFQEARFPKKVKLKNVSIPLENSEKELATLSVKATLFDQGTLKTLLKDKVGTRCKLDDNSGGEKIEESNICSNEEKVIKSKRLQIKEEKRKEMKEDNLEKSLQELQIKERRTRTRKQPKVNKEGEGDEHWQPNDSKDEENCKRKQNTDVKPCLSAGQ